MLAILTPLMSWSSVCLLLGNSTSRKTSENTDFLSEYLCLLTHGGFIQGSKKCFNNTVWHLNIAYKIEKNRISSPCIGHNVIHWIDNWVLFSLSRIWLYMYHIVKLKLQRRLIWYTLVYTFFLGHMSLSAYFNFVKTTAVQLRP